VAVMAAVLRYTGKGLRERLQSIRVGVSPGGFHYVAPSAPGNAPGKLAEGGPVPWTDVYYDGRRILAGGAAMQVRMPTGEEVFEREVFERQILSRIPRANFVSGASLGFRQLRTLPPMAKLMYAVSGAFAIATLILALLKT
jgi:hypothetical protein